MNGECKKDKHYRPEYSEEKNFVQNMNEKQIASENVCVYLPQKKNNLFIPQRKPLCAQNTESYAMFTAGSKAYGTNKWMNFK